MQFVDSRFVSGCSFFQCLPCDKTFSCRQTFKKHLLSKVHNCKENRDCRAKAKENSLPSSDLLEVPQHSSFAKETSHRMPNYSDLAKEVLNPELPGAPTDGAVVLEEKVEKAFSDSSYAHKPSATCNPEQLQQNLNKSHKMSKSPEFGDNKHSRCAKSSSLQVTDKSRDKSKALSCQFCPFTTSLKSSLIRHVNGHLDAKRFMCEVCGKILRTNNALK